MNSELRSSLRLAIAGFLSLSVLFGCASMKAPATTADGLVLRPDSDFRLVYVKPGATLKGYEEYGVVDCQVAFRKDWMRDQNSQRIDLSNRVTQQDVDRIKDSLASECDKFFREALLEDPAYPLVEEFSEGESVLILRPNIIDLDVYAPDLRSAGMDRTYTTSAGEMTLLLEVLDATTNEILVRVIDRQGGMETRPVQWSNSVTNKFEADRVLKGWSKRLREGLDKAVAH